ncbi:MAG TPA: MFS transporter [Dehalococcoidia bacterium]|nr:MFS transporter [Dehalococcoidia bacterium]
MTTEPTDLAAEAPQKPARSPRFFLGWTVVLAAGFAAFTEVAFFNPVLGVFLPEFEREFGWSRTEISAGVSLGSLLGALFAIYFGPLIDRYGGRVFVITGAAIMAVALMALSLMQHEWQFFVIYAVGRGAASGLIGLAAGVTVSKWFIRRRGFAVGITSLGSRAGFALMPIGVQLIIQTWDWRTAAITLSVTVLALGILPAIWWLHPRPERFGLEPDGDVYDDNDVRFARPPREFDWTRKEALRTPAFWLVTAAVALMSWAGGAINLHQIPHMVDRGLSRENAALVVTLFALFSAAGAIVEGFLDTRIGARWTMFVGLIGSAAGMVVLMNVSSFETGVLFAAVYGTAFGLMVTSNQVVFADYFGREALGAIRGSAAPMQLGLNAAGPIVAGVAYDSTGSYLAAFIPFTLAYLVAALALVLASKPTPPLRVGEDFT